ncbi:hypothetical protein AS593_21415 [Caulobacter vibrioides]|nr:hypothetical protein AS593_21415 [Caulobacter vibrioides]
MNVTASPPTDLQLQARIAHLTMIQGIIGRMAGYSASVKTFTLTIAAALIAVAIDKDQPVLFHAGAAIVFVFALLDAYYLAVEKCFRDLYGEVAGRDWSVALDLGIRQRPASLSAVLRASTSASIWGFYLLLLVSFASLPYVSSRAKATIHPGQKPPAAASPAKTPAK